MIAATQGRTRALALLALVFLAGAVAGAVVHRVVEKPRVVHRMRVQFGGGAGVYEQLGLSPQQKVRIDSVLNRYQPRTDSLLGPVLPRLHAVLDSADAAVRALLTPTQNARLDSLQSRPQR